jgi:hypothetical protein
MSLHSLDPPRVGPHQQWFLLEPPPRYSLGIGETLIEYFYGLFMHGMACRGAPKFFRKPYPHVCVPNIG